MCPAGQHASRVSHYNVSWPSPFHVNKSVYLTLLLLELSGPGLTSMVVQTFVADASKFADEVNASLYFIFCFYSGTNVWGFYSFLISCVEEC